MLVTVNRQVLATAFAWAVGAVPQRPVLSVLGGILLSVEDRTLTLGATDYEQGRRAWADDTWGDPEDGQALADSSTLKKVIAALPKGTRTSPADVRLSADAEKLTVTCQGAAWAVPLLPAGEYPPVPNLPPLAGTADGKQFALAVNRVAAAAGTDDTLPALTCVQFTPGATALTLASTDRYRVAAERLPWTAAEPPLPGAALQVPARAVAGFTAKAGKHGNVAVHIGSTDGGATGRIGFRDGIRELTVALFNGHTQPPQYGEFLRETSPVNLVVDAKALARALSRMNPVTVRGRRESTRAGIIDLRYSAGDLAVNALGPDLASVTASEHVPARADHPEFTVRFCGPYLLSLLDSIDGNAVIGLDTEDKGALDAGDFRTADVRQATVRVAGDDAFRAAIMPIQAGSELGQAR